MKKIRIGVGVFAVFLTGFLLYVQLTYEQTYEVPVTGLNAQTDSATIARGKYLTMGPAHCWTCHVENPAGVDLQQKPPAMSGGLALDLPWIARLYTPTIKKPVLAATAMSNWPR